MDAMGVSANRPAKWGERAMQGVAWEFMRYLPVSRQDRQWGLYVTGAGRVVDAASDYDNLTHPPPYASSWDKGWVLPCYAISYLINGQGEFEIGGRGAPNCSARQRHPAVPKHLASISRVRGHVDAVLGHLQRRLPPPTGAARPYLPVQSRS